MHRVVEDSDGLRWETPLLSKNDPDCADVAELPNGGALIRNSTDPDGAVVKLNKNEWMALLGSIRAGQYGRFH